MSLNDIQSKAEDDQRCREKKEVEGRVSWGEKESEEEEEESNSGTAWT